MQDNPIGPLDNNKLTTMIRKAADTVYNAAVIYNFENKSNIYRSDLSEVRLNQETVLSKIIVSPNPTAGKISIQFHSSQEQFEYVLVDFYGKTVQKGISSRNYLELDLGMFSSGVYLIKSFIDGKSYSEKIILKK